jgi:hypothetical protein
MKTSLNYPGQLHMDFGQNYGIGDTIWYNTPYSCDITAIDSIQFGSDARRLYTCGCSQSFHLIQVLEGFGSMGGIGDYSICPLVADGFGELLCYSINGFGLSFSNRDSCGLVPHITVGSVEQTDLEPSNIRWDNTQSAMNIPNQFVGYDWQLFDLAGSLLGKGKVAQTPLPLDLPQTGIYLFMLSKPGKGSKSLRFLRF